MTDTLGPLRPDEEKLYEGQPKGFPLGDYQSYLEDVMLPEGNDFGIVSDDDSIDEDEIETETGFGSVIGKVQPAEGVQNLHYASVGLKDLCALTSLAYFGRPRLLTLVFQLEK